MDIESSQGIAPSEPSDTTRVVVVGCGIIGAAIAYELSQVSGLQVTVLDQKRPATESTGAALGVLMGAISQKKKGRAWALRDASLRRYATLIPELEARLQRSLPVNRHGIVLLQIEDASPPDHRQGHDLDADSSTVNSSTTGLHHSETSLPAPSLPEVSQPQPSLWMHHWQPLVELRHQQGWSLECWNQQQLYGHCPQVGTHLGDRPIVGAVYSPQDIQISPVALTEALVEAAQLNGTTFDFAAPVTAVQSSHSHAEATLSESLPSPPYILKTPDQTYEADWVIIAAGLGSAEITRSLHQPIDVRPVLGQAVRLRLDTPMGDPQFQPVISGDDIHIVPLGAGEYWVGATVEFPDAAGHVRADETQLQQVLSGAIALCPTLADATLIDHWSGLRPRPWNQGAPVIQPLSGHAQVWLATAHYRNGVLLAPATAAAIRSVLEPVPDQPTEPASHT